MSGLKNFKPAIYKKKIQIKIFSTKAVLFENDLEDEINNYLENLDDNQTFKFIKYQTTSNEYQTMITVIVGTEIKILK